jgi:hypothetical protein
VVSSPENWQTCTQDRISGHPLDESLARGLIL